MRSSKRPVHHTLWLIVCTATVQFACACVRVRVHLCACVRVGVCECVCIGYYDREHARLLGTRISGSTVLLLEVTQAVRPLRNNVIARHCAYYAYVPLYTRLRKVSGTRRRQTRVCYSDRWHIHEKLADNFSVIKPSILGGRDAMHRCHPCDVIYICTLSRNLIRTGSYLFEMAA